MDALHLHQQQLLVAGRAQGEKEAVVFVAAGTEDQVHLARLRGIDALRAIPVVVLTTSDAERDVAVAYQRGVASYLTKPVDFTKFVQLMDSFGFYWLVWNRYPAE